MQPITVNNINNDLITYILDIQFYSHSDIQSTAAQVTKTN